MKKALDINEQMQRLKERGMLFDDESKAKEILLDVGFYRLGFYSFPFEQSYPSLDNRTHKLQSGTTFKAVYDLYEFDRQLRRILLNALDRIEVNVRTKITYIVSNHYKQSPTWFADKTIMETAYVDSFKSKVYDTILGNDVIKRHHAKHINDKFARYISQTTPMQPSTIEELQGHYREILRLLGEDPQREGLLKTPLRVAKAMQDLTSGYATDPIAILNSAKFQEPYDQMVIVKDINFHSLCEHHMLPFYGKAHVAYIPNGYITGIRSLLDENKASQANKIIQECTKISL